VTIVGLDLSLTATGIATPDSRYVVDPGRRRGPERLDYIAAAVREACSPARMVAVEGYAFGRPQGMAALGEVGGLVRWLLWRLGVPYVDVPPASLKRYATGHGNAPKDEVLAAAIRRLNYDGHDHNVADAMWLRAMAYDAYGDPVVVVPAEHRKAIGALRWPALRTVETVPGA
jgi:Holliday junction resolvasome RuvABC endonuclease subunit